MENRETRTITKESIDESLKLSRDARPGSRTGCCVIAVTLGIGWAVGDHLANKGSNVYRLPEPIPKCISEFDRLVAGDFDEGEFRDRWTGVEFSAAKKWPKTR